MFGTWGTVFFSNYPSQVGGPLGLVGHVMGPGVKTSQGEGPPQADQTENPYSGPHPTQGRFCIAIETSSKNTLSCWFHPACKTRAEHQLGNNRARLFRLSALTKWAKKGWWGPPVPWLWHVVASWETACLVYHVGLSRWARFASHIFIQLGPLFPKNHWKGQLGEWD